MRTAVAVTRDGQTFRCRSVGAEGLASGEAVFNTAMSGYQEIFTDPSYAGQLVVMTAPQIGNYGVNAADDQSTKVFASGVIMRAMTRSTSNWRAEGSLSEFFVERGVVAVADLDTRRLTRHLRDHGAQPMVISSGHNEAELKELAAGLSGMQGRDLATSVSTPEPYFSPAVGEKRGVVVALDLGIKRDILKQLNGHGHDVWVMPAGREAQIQAVFGAHGRGTPLAGGWRLKAIRVAGSAVRADFAHGTQRALILLQAPSKRPGLTRPLRSRNFTVRAGAAEPAEVSRQAG